MMSKLQDFIAGVLAAAWLSIVVGCGLSEQSFSSLEERLALESAKKVPVLTKPLNEYKLHTAERFALDFKNELNGSDEGMSYTCIFDVVIDKNVKDGKPCSALPAAAADAFDEKTGQLNWGPLTQVGSFELLITGKNDAGTDFHAFSIIVTLNNIPSLTKIRDQRTDANRTLIVAAVNGNTSIQEAVKFACVWDDVVDDSVLTQVSCDNLSGEPKGKKFDEKAGVLSWTPPMAAVGSYEIKITVSNSAGADQQVFPIFVDPDPNTPVLTRIESEYTAFVGSTFTLDFNDERIGSDRGMTYSCRFDRTIDGKVPGSRDCDNLPGDPDMKFDSSSGRMRWGPISAEDKFEIRVVGENIAGFSEQIFLVKTITNRKPVLIEVLDQRINANRNFNLNVTNSNPDANVNLSYTCTYDTSLDGSVSAGQNCDVLNGIPATKFNAQTGAFTWTPANAAMGSYELSIKAINAVDRAEQVFKVIVDPDPDTPVLTKVAPVINAYIGDTMTLDFKNEKTGSDTGMNYSCAYDLVVDGHVNEASDCSSLPDGPSSKFSAGAGVLSWGPLQTTGHYEIAIRGQNIAGQDEVIFSIRIQQNQAPRLSRILDKQMEAGQSFLVVPQNATALNGDQVTYTCRFDLSIDGAVSNSANLCATLPGQPSIKFDSSVGTLNWLPDNTMIGSYEFRIRATNSYGFDEKIFVLVVTPSITKKVKLGYIRNVAVITGETVSVDAINSLTNSDVGMSYSCYYDALVDGEVSNTQSCDLLSGTPTQKFNPVSGALSWTPDLLNAAELELRIVGIKEDDSDGKTFVVTFATQRFGDVGNSAIVFDPNSWDFGSVSLNQSSAAKSVTLTNNSTSSVYIGSISSSNSDFILNWSACPTGSTTMASQASCVINLSFRPSTSNQLGSALSVRFGKTAATSSDYSSVMGLSGRGVGTLTFDGLQTISNVTHNSLRLNWNATPQAVSFLVFQVVNGNLVYLQTLLNSGGTVNSLNLKNLSPSTSYTYRVRATDYVGIVDSNLNNVTAMTKVNQAPSISSGPMAWVVYTERTISPLDFYDTFTNIDTDRDGDTITYSCRFDNKADGVVADDAPMCHTLFNVDTTTASFDGLRGVLSNWKPIGSSLGASYEMKVVAFDFYGAASESVFSTTVASGAPLITGVSDFIFPNVYRRPGESIDLDFNNTRFQPANDLDMSYACTFRTLASSDSSAASCSGLSGAFNFDTATGVFGWTPNTAAVGAYSITVTGTNLADSHSRTFRVSVLPAIDDALRLLHVDARFAYDSRGGQNSISTTTNWGDILSNPTSNTFGNLMNFNTASAWVGANSPSDPAAISFDGVDDFVNFGNTLFSPQQNLHFDAWVYQDFNAREKVIFSQGNSSDQGIILTDRRLYLGNGNNTAYRNAVIEDSPAFYWRFDDISGGTVADSGTSPSTRSGVIRNAMSSGSPPQPLITSVDDATFDLSGSGVMTSNLGGLGSWIQPNSNYNLGSTWSIEVWFNYPLPGGCKDGWCTLTQGNTVADHQIIIQEKTYLLGVYKTKSAVVTPANGFISSGYTIRDLNHGWHHLVAVGTGGQTLFYVNGVLVGTANYQPVDDLHRVGGLGTGQSFGRIDEFAVYTTALTLSRIQAHYNAGRKNQCTFSLVKGFWYHIAGTIDDGTDTGTLYINGSQVCSFSKPAIATVGGSSTPLTIGRSSSGAGSSWKGKLSSLIFYQDASTTNIETNYAATSFFYSRQNPVALMGQGLRLWLRADQGLFQDASRAMIASANEDPVLIWENMTGNGEDMAVRSASNQVTARPKLRTNALGGQPAVSFDGVDDVLQNTIAYGFPNTIFIVAHYNGSSPRGRILSGTSTNWLMGWHAGSWDQFHPEAWVYMGPTTATNAWKIYSADHAYGLQRLFGNNQLVGSSSDLTSMRGPIGGLTLGSHQGSSQWSICEVAELIVYDRILTNTERQKVLQYLNQRYSVY